jgi:hypothetical protein
VWGDAEWIQPAGQSEARFAVAVRYYDDAPSGTDRLRGLPLYWRLTDGGGNFSIMRSVRQ